MSVHRKGFSNEIKLKAVLAYEAGASAASLGREYGCHANVVHRWVQLYRKNPDTAFRETTPSPQDRTAAEKRIAELEQMVGRITMEVDFLKKTLKRAESALKSVPPVNGNK